MPAAYGLKLFHTVTFPHDMDINCHVIRVDDLTRYSTIYLEALYFKNKWYACKIFPADWYYIYMQNKQNMQNRTMINIANQNVPIA